MSAPIDLVLSSLAPFKLRENGSDRWRAVCPAHGGSNPSTLSVGVGDDGAVLLKCFSGCSADEVAHALGFELSDLFPPKPQPGGGRGPIKRRRLLTAQQALEVLEDEMRLAQICSADLAQGNSLTDETRQRLLQGAARVALMREEVRA